MTTILGIKANRGLEGIVFCSDMQFTYYSEDDIIIRKEVGKEKKLSHGNNWVFGFQGIVSREITEFRDYLTNPEKYGSSKKNVTSLFKRSVDNYKKGDKFKGKFHCKKLHDIYQSSLAKGIVEEDMGCYILGMYIKGKLGLWKIDESGVFINEIDKYLPIGSGANLLKTILKKI